MMDDENAPHGESDREPTPRTACARSARSCRPCASTRLQQNRVREPGELLQTHGGVGGVGASHARRGLVERSEEALGNTGALRKSSKYVTRGRGDVGLAAWFRQWARLERVAVSLCTYECRLVPGLLQSEGYARAVFEGTVPVAPDSLLEDFMTRRMERQRMLFDRPTTPFSFIVEEHVFRRRFGDPDQMRQMLDHVLELTEPRNVTLQVVPLEAGLHACLDGPLQLLETPRGQRLGYSEGQQNGRLISDVKEVSLLCQRYDTLRSQALNAKDSRGLLERLRGEL